jgi:hypothetical protein
MVKIGTHNSATGMKGKGWLSWLVTPFAKCQSKTIREQYEAGCRMFDIRVKWHEGRLVCAHGLWRSRRLAYNILNEIDWLGGCIVILTYEGGLSVLEEAYFKNYAQLLKVNFPDIIWREVCIKKGWKCIMFSETKEKNTKDFATKDKSWLFCLLPIPWLWKKFSKKVEFDENTFKLVDFL